MYLRTANRFTFFILCSKTQVYYQRRLRHRSQQSKQKTRILRPQQRINQWRQPNRRQRRSSDASLAISCLESDSSKGKQLAKGRSEEN